MSCMIQSIDSTKAFQKNDIPPNFLKANEDICSILLTTDINRCIVNGTFPQNIKKMTVYLKVTTDPSAYYRRYLKYMKKFFICKSMIISITFFQNIMWI